MTVFCVVTAVLKIFGLGRRIRLALTLRRSFTHSPVETTLSHRHPRITSANTSLAITR